MTLEEKYRLMNQISDALGIHTLDTVGPDHFSHQEDAYYAGIGDTIDAVKFVLFPEE